MSRFFTGLSILALSLLLSLVVLVASSTEAPAQTSIFDTYNDAAYKAFQSGDLDTSEKMYTAALSQAQVFGQTDPRYIKCLEGLAILQAQRLVDVCHSGSVAAGQKGLFRQNLDPKNLVIGQGQIVVCSSSSEQVSWESKEYPNSVFTKQLIEALNNKGGDATLSEACLIMSDRVEEEVLRDRNGIQTPIVKRSWEGGGDLVHLDSSAQPLTSGATSQEGKQ